MTCLEGIEVPACMCAVELLLVSYPCDIFWCIKDPHLPALGVNTGLRICWPCALP